MPTPFTLPHPPRQQPLHPLALACTLLLTAPAAWAQAAPPPDGDDVPHLPDVRVQASTPTQPDPDKSLGFAPTQAQSASKVPMRLLETPHSVSVITREQMESRQVGNLQEALQTAAGVSPVNFGRRGFDDIFIRGFRSTESILIDGLKQSGGMWMRLNPYGYDRFEVLRGAASLLYGQVQPGGVVNAVSKRPGPDTFGEASLRVGSFGQKTLSADINRPLSASGRSALRINAQIADTRDATDFVFRKDRWFAPALSLDLGADTQLTLLASYNQGKWLRQQGVTPYGTLLPNPNGRIPLSRFTGEPSFGNYDIEQVSVGYALEHRINPHLTLRQNLRHETRKGTGNFVGNAALQADGRLQNRNATRQYIDNSYLTADTSLLAQFSAWGMQHRLVTGLDASAGRTWMGLRRCRIPALDLFNPSYGMAADCPSSLTQDAPSRLHTVALYAQDQIKFAQGWTALMGLRHDRARSRIDNRVAQTVSRQNDSATTFSGGLVREFAPGWSVYGSYSESFLPVSGLAYGGTPFVPETGQQWEAGLKYEAPAGGLTGALALYELRRQNVTTADPVNEGFSVQTGEQRARGLELEMGLDLARGWKAVAAYTYTDARVTRDNNAAIVGKPINLTPRHTLSAWATHRISGQPITLGLGGRYVSRQRGALPFSLPAYFVADASLVYTGKHFRVGAAVKNLFNRRYYAGAINANVVSPAEPRSFSVQADFFF
ncbi:MAG: TonB-dependent siderophore receptor [Pseudomonadota bacterium]|nr:TonB-dependent siderophore receptor [Pseudomonadota bacterium]